MTKQEAIDLEKQCEDLLVDALNKADLINTESDLLTVGLTLNNRFRIVIGSNAYLFNKDLKALDWFQFTGFYSDFDNIVFILKRTIREYKSDFEKLIWSYENRRELED